MNSNLGETRYICANTIDVVKNFAIRKNVAVKSFDCKQCIRIQWHLA